MGFGNQLRLLLWKNFKLKTRRPIVSTFELVIPLVLFFILYSIRIKKPTEAKSQVFYHAKPLPSAGIIPILQTFCPESSRDPYGFSDYPDSTVEIFLQHIYSVATENDIFNENFTIDKINLAPKPYYDLLKDNGTIEQQFADASDFTLNSVLINSEDFKHYLIQNLSFSENAANNIIHFDVNPKEVYKLLYGTKPHGTKSDEKSHPTSIQDYLFQRLQACESGVVCAKFLADTNSTLSQSEMIMAVLSQSLDLKSLSPKVIMSQGYQPKLLAQDFEDILLDPEVLHSLLCNHNQQLLVSNVSKSSINITEDITEFLCNMSMADFSSFTHELKSQINTSLVANQLHFDQVDILGTKEKVSAVFTEIEKYTVFTAALSQLVQLAKDLPSDSCAANYTEPAKKNHTSLSPADPIKFDNLNLEDIAAALSYANSNSSDGVGIPAESDDDKDSQAKKMQQFYKTWAKMQKVLCGVEGKFDPEALDSSDPSAVELTNYQKKSLQLLVYVLFSNPRILYAPNTTDVNALIEKASAFLTFTKTVTHYAEVWLEISQEIRRYLHQNTTLEAYKWLREIKQEMQSQIDNEDDGLLANWTDSFIFNNFLGGNILPPQVSIIEQELDLIDNAACAWINTMSQLKLEKLFMPFKNEKALIDYTLFKAYEQNVTVFAGLVFEVDDKGKLPPHVVYKIRQNSTFTEQTSIVRSQYWSPGPNHNKQSGNYYQFGFVWIQDVIERAIIDTFVGKTVEAPGAYVQEMPYPCYIKDSFVTIIQDMVPLVMVLSWVYYVAMLTQNIVYEKEQGLKEVMKTMGLSNVVHWIAWFITSFLQMSITIFSLVFLLKYGKILSNSNILIVWIYLTIYAIATIMFCFMLSVLFSKAKLAAACAGILYFLSYVPYLYLFLRENVAFQIVPTSSKIIASLLSTSAFGLGSKYIALFEEQGVGVQWYNIHISPIQNDEFNLVQVCLMMIMDIFIYAFLTWYIEAVHPGSYGLPRPFYFPFQKSYWFGSDKTENSESCCYTDWIAQLRSWWKPEQSYLSVMEEEQAGAMAAAAASSNEDEDGDLNSSVEEAPHLAEGVSIENLVKVYKTGKKLAVNKLNLKFYEGQITSFLGHNGAGKTTTLSILTGLFPPTSGTAYVYGHDIRNEMLQIRQILGFCPQHNALFDKLTVAEHIGFYSRLKGVPSYKINKEIERLIKDVGLFKKRHSMVESLSGGMKRKLSVAIAFVGDSQLVILDEPTAGVDPYSRRAIWDLLIKYKNDRTIILSTHHMDEADILGDRIAIISHGQLKCCGSSLYLKSMYGDGYRLTLVKKPHDMDSAQPMTFEEEQEKLSAKKGTLFSKCSSEKVTCFLCSHISSAYLASETIRELVYILPLEAVKKGNLAKLFAELSSSLEELHISTYGLADTSLEEVFLKVAQHTNVNSSTEEPNNSNILNKFAQVLPMLRSFYSSWRSSNSAPGILPVSSNAMENSLLENPLIQSQSDDYAQNTEDRTLQNPSAGPRDLDLLSTCPDGDLGAEVELHQTDYFSEEDKMGSDLTVEEVYRRQQESGDLLSSPESNRRNFGDVSQQQSPSSLEGTSSHRQTGLLLRLMQFHAALVKRFHYTKRSRKGLFSQLFLPAIFVCIAMTVAIVAPQVGNSPPLVLSPSQYHSLEGHKGNYIPYSNEAGYSSSYQPDGDFAGAKELASTLQYPAGIGATCVLKSAFDSELNDIVGVNITLSLPLPEYFDKMCAQWLQAGPPIGIDLHHTIPPYSNKRIYFIYGNATITEKTCVCANSGNGFVCPKNVGTPSPPNYLVVTQDILEDVSERKNISEYLLYTSDKFREHRYGALTFGNIRSFVPKFYEGVTPKILRSLATREAAMVYHNHKGIHSMPTYLNALNNAILRANLDPKIHGNPSAYGITVINHPLNKTSSSLSTEYIFQGTDVVIAIFIIVALSFVPASFVLFLVSERASKAKHLQFVGSMNPFIYWASNYVWDMFNYFIPATCCIGILLLFDVSAYTSSTNLPAVIALFLLYGWSITPIMYPASFFFDVPSTAYVFLIVTSLFIGITTVVGGFFLQLFSYDEGLKEVGDQLNQAFLIFPNYCLGRGLMELAYNDYFNQYYSLIGAYDMIQSPFEWSIITRLLVVMAVEGLVFFIINVLCEYRFFIQPRLAKISTTRIDDEDEDVARERRRVLRGSACHDLLRLENLTKVYKTRNRQHLAVDRLCLGIPQGECFGLLGVNGAGKTTSFKMLTGDLSLTGGDAFLNGYSISKEMIKVHQYIGYCPQFDALFDELTAREHLYLYSRLKGIPAQEQKEVVDWAIKKLALSQHADRPAGTYSGGNKRKLSTAIALIGHPPVIFMDEPTTGMDPHSRRFLWDLILNLIKGGRSVVLTSHSMEECEALCTRLAIMVNGRFRCLGSTQHLKSRFGAGYTITIRVKEPRPKTRPIVEFFERTFPHSILKELHHNMVQYELSTDSVSLKDIFHHLEGIRDILHIEDYSVRQTTLDNVFINFAKHQCDTVEHDSNQQTFENSQDAAPLLSHSDLSRVSFEGDIDDDDDEPLINFGNSGARLLFQLEDA